MATVGTRSFERALVGTVPEVRRGQLAVDARAIGVIEVEKSGPVEKIIGGGVKQDAAKSQGCMLGLAHAVRTAIPRPRESTRRGSLPCVSQTEWKFRGGRPRPHLTCKDPGHGAFSGQGPLAAASRSETRPFSRDARRSPRHWCRDRRPGRRYARTVVIRRFLAICAVGATSRKTERRWGLELLAQEKGDYGREDGKNPKL